MDLSAVYAYVDEHFDRFIGELRDFCRIPSVGGDEAGMAAAERWLLDKFRALGFDTRSMPWPGAHPFVYAALPGDPRSVLFFNHYDIANYTNPIVYPEDPNARGPFSGDLADGKLYARGVTDDKGTLTARMHAVEALLAVHGRVPVATKFLVEGKATVSGPIIDEFVAANHELLRADCCLWEAGAKDEKERQTISLGHKGHVYVDLVVRGTDRTWPSRYTLFPNPAWRLTWALAALKGTDERVRLPGFYDAVRPVGEAEEREVYAHLSDNTAGLLEQAGLTSFVSGLQGREALVHQYSQPSLAICGLEAGARGPGQALVLPRDARAKIEFRLVPDQDPEQVLGALRSHLDAHGFDDVEIEVVNLCPPYKVDPDAWLPRLVKRAADEVLPNGGVFTPVATGIGKRYVFDRWLEMPIVGFAIGYWGYRIETNDEHIRLEDYRDQVKWVARILADLAEQDKN
jgi:acetylornithine deacetylase/succinyl-diaminopimelate desuccinylase-like protein